LHRFVEKIFYPNDSESENDDLNNSIRNTTRMKPVNPDENHIVNVSAVGSNSSSDDVQVGDIPIAWQRFVGNIVNVCSQQDVADMIPSFNRHSLSVICQQIMDVVPMGVFMMESSPADGSHTLTYANEKFQSETGYTMAELHGKTLRIFENELYSERLQIDAMKNALHNGEKCRVAITHVRKKKKDGDEKVVDHQREDKKKARDKNYDDDYDEDNDNNNDDYYYYQEVNNFEPFFNALFLHPIASGHYIGLQFAIQHRIENEVTVVSDENFQAAEVLMALLLLLWDND
jgi:PAS domain S-box-containing protein